MHFYVAEFVWKYISDAHLVNKLDSEARSQVVTSCNSVQCKQCEKSDMIMILKWKTFIFMVEGKLAGQIFPCHQRMAQALKSGNSKLRNAD